MTDKKSPLSIHDLVSQIENDGIEYLPHYDWMLLIDRCSQFIELVKADEELSPKYLNAFLVEISRRLGLMIFGPNWSHDDPEIAISFGDRILRATSQRLFDPNHRYCHEYFWYSLIGQNGGWLLDSDEETNEPWGAVIRLLTRTIEEQLFSDDPLLVSAALAGLQRFEGNKVEALIDSYIKQNPSKDLLAKAIATRSITCPP